MIDKPIHRFTKRDAPAMICPNCNSDNVTISYVQTKSNMKHKGSGLIGNSNNILRWIVILFSLGLAWFFWPASKGTSKVKHHNQRHAVCQNCGKGWRIR